MTRPPTTARSRPLFIGAVLAVAGIVPTAPVGAQDMLRENFEAKIGAPWVKANPWVLDFAEAKRQAAERDVPIFGYFTRSYAPCPPCKALENGALSAPEFAEFAENVVLFLHVTTRIDGHPDDNLLGRLGGNSFPTLYYLNQSGQKIGQPMGHSVAAFQRDLEGVVEKARLATAEAKESHARAQAFLAKLRFKLLKGPAGIREYLEHKPDLDDEEQRRVEAYFAHARLEQAVKQAADQNQDAAARDRAVLEIFAAKGQMNGSLPRDEVGLEALHALLNWADAHEDPLLFHNLLAELRVLLPAVEKDETIVTEALGRMQARLDALLQ